MQIQSTTAAVLFPKEFLATFLLTRKHVTLKDLAPLSKPYQPRGKGRREKPIRELTEDAVYAAICDGLFLDTDIGKRIGKCVTTVRAHAKKLKEKGLVDVKTCGPKNTKYAYFQTRG